MGDLMFGGEILQATFCGTNVPVGAEFYCHHPVLTDDGPTAPVWSWTQHWNLKLEYAFSQNRNELNECNYLTFSSDQWLQNIQDVL